MERHMDNERKAGAGRAVEEASKDIDRRHQDEDAIPGAGPEITRHIARETPETARDGDKDDDEMDEDEEDEDLEDDTEDEDEDRGTTPV
jgi:hypothetical protein